MSFLTGIIASFMEDPIERDEKEYKRINNAYNDSILRKSEANQPAGNGLLKYKINKEMAANSGFERGNNGVGIIDSNYIVNSSSKANSYSSLLHILSTTKY